MELKNFDYDLQLAIEDSCEGFIESSMSIEDFCRIMDIYVARYKAESFVKGLMQLGYESFTPEEKVLIFFHCDHIMRWGISPLDSRTFNDRGKWSILEPAQRQLLEKGIIEYVSASSDAPEKVVDRKDRTVLCAHAVGKLFYGNTCLISMSTLARHATVITASAITSRALYFDGQTEEEINRVKKFLDPENFNAIMQRMEERGRSKSATFIFHGPPGTGKTELVKQLAIQTGRDIILVDVAKLHSSFTGDTEKNYRELFRGYRYLAQLSPNVPILLFNEADGILSKRGDVLRQAVDKILNRIQSLLLQELEDFEGIIVATTNLVENMDQAFERRFLFKIRFDEPNLRTRSHIWASMLPELDSGTVRTLASAYRFTGAQIENIARKYDIDELLNGQKPTLNEILAYCESEVVISKKGQMETSDSAGAFSFVQGARVKS